MSETKELALLSAPINPVAVFTPAGATDLLTALDAKIAAMPRDISTKKGRDEIASNARKIASTKTGVDNIGKEFLAETKAKIKVIDAERSKLWDEIEKRQHEYRKPLTDWENAEKERVAEHESNLAHLKALAVFEIPEPPLDLINDRIAAMSAFAERNWQEFSQRYQAVRDLTAGSLADLKARTMQREEERAELARLKAEQEAREKAEREADIARQAAEAARREAEEAAAKAAAEAAERAAAEQARIEAEAAAALQAAEQARLAQEKAAADKLAAEQAERARVERERQEAEERAAKAEADAKAAAEKAEADRIAAELKAKRDAEAAVEAERQRIADEQAKEKAEAEAREKDKKHKAAVNRDAVEKLVEYAMISEETAKAVVTAIAKGQIPNVKISY